MKRQTSQLPSTNTKRRAYNQRNGDNDVWQQLHRTSLQLLENAQFGEAIDSCYQALKEVDIVRVTIMDTCAIAFKMGNRLNDALRIADVMIASAPAVAIGYLRAGEILALQGRHQTAIQILEYGAKMVPMDDEQYTALDVRTAESRAKLDQRVDFLTLLPKEITRLIIEKLNVASDKSQEYTEVSKGWRQAIMDSPLAWYTMNPMESTDFRFLPSVGKYVQVLGFNSFAMDKMQVIFNAVLSGQLCNVRELRIKNCAIGKYQLPIMLSRLSNTLMKLTLSIEKEDCVVPLESILLACPKLKVLRYHIYKGEIRFSETDTPMMTEHSIEWVHLDERSITTTVTKNTFQHILRLCPRLQKITINPCTTAAFKLINDHISPQLKAFGFNGIYEESNNTRASDNRPGLQSLSIHTTKHLDPETVIQLLTKSQSTLQSAALVLDDKRPNIPGRWDGLAKINFENLTALKYAFGNSMEMHTLVAGMIRNSKALDYVRLQGLVSLSGCVLEEALIELPRLRTLRLSGLKSVDVAGLVLFFEAHARMEVASSLREVYIKRCDNIPVKLLKTLANVKNLQKIHIEYCKGLTVGTMSTFMNQLIISNTLESLAFIKLNTVTDSLLWDAAKLSTLKSIHLAELPHISRNAVDYLLSRIKGLKINLT